jgi:hypothetical protein
LRFGWSSSRPVSSTSLRSQIEPGSIYLGAGRIEQELLVDAGIERRRHRQQR